MIQVEELEIVSLDTRYEGLKVKDPDQEAKLLGKMVQQQEIIPLLITMVGTVPVILDGFKRYRAAKQLNWTTIQCKIIGHGESEGIIQLLILRQGLKMSHYEEASFISELHRQQGLTTSEIARKTGRSPAWASMRLNFLANMSNTVKVHIQSGRFPLHAWMHSVRPFTRVNDKNRQLVDEFVGIVAKEKHSLRDIEILAKLWFEGKEELRAEIRKGNGNWIINSAHKDVAQGHIFSAVEQQFLKDLSHLEKLARKKCACKLNVFEKSSPDFKVQANLICNSINGIIEPLKLKIKEMYAKFGTA